MQRNIVIVLAIVAIAFIVIAVSFYQYFAGGKSKAPQDTPEAAGITYPRILPEEVVRGFYEWYLTEGNTLPTDLYLGAPELTDALKKRIPERVGGRDPFFCAMEKPETIHVRSGTIHDFRATVPVDAQFSPEEALSFEVELLAVGDIWKIDNILCFIKG